MSRTSSVTAGSRGAHRRPLTAERWSARRASLLLPPSPVKLCAIFRVPGCFSSPPSLFWDFSGLGGVLGVKEPSLSPLLGIQRRGVCFPPGWRRFNFPFQAVTPPTPVSPGSLGPSGWWGLSFPSPPHNIGHEGISPMVMIFINTNNWKSNIFLANV